MTNVLYVAVVLFIIFAPDVLNVVRMMATAIPDTDELIKVPFGKRV